MADDVETRIRNRLVTANRLAEQLRYKNVEVHDVLYRPGAEMGLDTWSWCEVLKHPNTVHLPKHLRDRCVGNTFKECIGSGGGGVVLVGWLPAMDRYCALKFAPHEAIAELLVEAVTLALAGGEIRGVVQILGLLNCSGALPPDVHRWVMAALRDLKGDLPNHLARGVACLVLELYDGSLADALDGRLHHCPSPVMRAAWACQLFAALYNLHTRLGVFHRDVKPANVLVSGAGANTQLAITDFGRVQSADSRKVSLFLEKYQLHGRLLGTPGFMDPDAVGAKQDGVAAALTLMDLIGGANDLMDSQERAQKGFHVHNRVARARASIGAAKDYVDLMLTRKDHFAAAHRTWADLPREVAFAMTVGAHALLNTHGSDVSQLLLGMESLAKICVRALTRWEAKDPRHVVHLVDVLSAAKASPFLPHLAPIIIDNIDDMLGETQDAVKRLPFAPLAVFSTGQAGTAVSAVAAAARLAAGAWQAAAAAAGRPRKRPRV